MVVKEERISVGIGENCGGMIYHAAIIPAFFIVPWRNSERYKYVPWHIFFLEIRLISLSMYNDKVHLEFCKLR